MKSDEKQFKSSEFVSMDSGASEEASEPARRQFPFATSPDILRSHEKDAYVTSTLTAEAISILRTLFGARFTHRHSSTVGHLTELLYLCLTTLLGNRTLGEEYCDVIQVEDGTLRLPSLIRRVGYIASIVFAPWALSKTLPALRRKLRAKLERNIQKRTQLQAQNQSRTLWFQEYVLKHLDAMTSPNPVYALSLAAFYFTGSYYHLSKRLVGFRYIFTRQRQPSQQHGGYEVLGALLVLQMIVQGLLHIRQTAAEVSFAVEESSSKAFTTKDTAEQPLQSSLSTHAPHGLSQTLHTPILSTPHYDLADRAAMSWIPAGQQRKCTLCLEPLRDPSVTTCGHVFCWTCIQDWVREKAECPLCRQAILAQKILPLRS